MEDKLFVKSKELYDAINRYYTLLTDSITLEDYNSIKDMLEYTENYEDHIKQIKSSIKPENGTINEIKNFLTTYTEFQKKHYTNMIHHVCDEIEKNPQKFKHEAYKGILKFVEDLNNYNEDINEEDDNVDDNVDDNGNVDDNVDDNVDVNNDNVDDDLSIEENESVYYVGNTEIIIKTYDDPLLRNLYNVLFMIFETENGF